MIKLGKSSLLKLHPNNVFERFVHLSTIVVCAAQICLRHESER